MPIRKKGDRLNAKKRFDPITGEEINKPKPPRTIYAPKPQVPPERQMRTGGLSPKQKAIASKAPPPNKITGADFAVLKKEKAKGRGMGLQDESIKPGKVMKARTGHFAKSNISKHERVLKPDTTKPISSVAPKVTDALKKKKLPGRIGTALGIGAMMVPAAYAAAKQYKDYKSAKNRDKAKVKKMGGGMMQRPMGYDYGGKVKTKPASKKRKEEGLRDDTFDPIMKKPEGMKKELAMIQTEEAISKRNIGDGGKMTKRGLMKVVDAAADDKQLGRSLRKFQRDVFKTGGSVMARGCKLGRTKKTKLY